MLGLPGDYTEEPCRDCYATKVGGRPAPPAGVPAGALSRVCGLCKGEMRLVLQAHAPVRGLTPVPDRFLYVLCCGAPESPCVLQPGGWAALRCVAPPVPPPATFTAPEGPAKPAAGGGTSWFEEAGGDWGGGGSDGDGDDGGDSDLEALTGSLVAAMADCRAPSQAMKEAEGEPNGSPLPECSAKGGEGGGGQEAGPLPPAGCLPEFYLYAEYEPARSGKSAGDDPHIQALLREYQEEEEVEKSAGQPAASGSGSGGAAAATGLVPDVGAGSGPAAGGWEVEGWEEDLEGDALEEFQERLRLSPHQCVRYGGELLWPKAKLPDFGFCEVCGCRREAELVLVPGLLSALEEAGAGPQAPWLAVAVGACQAACTLPDPSEPVVSEPVAVVAEL